MNENIKIMLEKLANDVELQQNFGNIATPDEAYAFACSIHGGYTKEEFIETMQALRDLQDADVTDEDLNKIAGGEGEEKKNDITMITLGVMSSACTIFVGAAAI